MVSPPWSPPHAFSPKGDVDLLVTHVTRVVGIVHQHRQIQLVYHSVFMLKLALLAGTGTSCPHSRACSASTPRTDAFSAWLFFLAITPVALRVLPSGWLRGFGFRLRLLVLVFLLRPLFDPTCLNLHLSHFFLQVPARLSRVREVLPLHIVGSDTYTFCM